VLAADRFVVNWSPHATRPILRLSVSSPNSDLAVTTDGRDRPYRRPHSLRALFILFAFCLIATPLFCRILHHPSCCLTRNPLRRIVRHSCTPTTAIRPAEPPSSNTCDDLLTLARRQSGSLASCLRLPASPELRNLNTFGWRVVS
jgi:hypothetical protein